MQDTSLLKRGAQCPVQAVLKIERALPLDDVSKQIAVEGGVLGQQGAEVEVAFGGDELFEPDHAWRDVSPVPSCLQPVVGIGTPVAHGFEDHRASLGCCRETRSRPASFRGQQAAVLHSGVPDDRSPLPLLAHQPGAAHLGEHPLEIDSGTPQITVSDRDPSRFALLQQTVSGLWRGFRHLNRGSYVTTPWRGTYETPNLQVK